MISLRHNPVCYSALHNLHDTKDNGSQKLQQLKNSYFEKHVKIRDVKHFICKLKYRQTNPI